MTDASSLIRGFRMQVADVNDQHIAHSIGGSGPPVLLLHGFPQTHAMWHAVAPILARDFTVVASDLRGYGASSKPKGTSSPYSFRHMATDQRLLMQQLGFETFHVVGHDRGARTAHRLALDAPDAVRSLTLMDVIPTHLLLGQLSKETARDYFHWFFLSQPYPFAETMIARDPDAFFETCLLGWGGAKLTEFDAAALAAYRASWRDPETIRGMCADYRATIDIDFDLDNAGSGNPVTCPALVLYGASGVMARSYDVPATWQQHLENMQSQAINGGHFFVDQNGAETAAALHAFLSQVARADVR